MRLQCFSFQHQASVLQLIVDVERSSLDLSGAQSQASSTATEKRIHQSILCTSQSLAEKVDELRTAAVCKVRAQKTRIPVTYSHNLC